MKIELDDGKYTYILDNNGSRALRYGEAWRDCTGDGFILALAQKVAALEEFVEVVEGALGCTDGDDIREHITPALAALKQEKT